MAAVDAPVPILEPNGSNKDHSGHVSPISPALQGQLNPIPNGSSSEGRLLDAINGSQSEPKPRRNGEASLDLGRDLPAMSTDSRQLPSPALSARSSSSTDFFSDVTGRDVSTPSHIRRLSSPARSNGATTLRNLDSSLASLDTPYSLSKRSSLQDRDLRQDSGRPRKTSLNSKAPSDSKQLKLSPSEITELTSTPESLPISAVEKVEAPSPLASSGFSRDITGHGLDSHQQRPQRGRASSSMELPSLRRSSHGVALPRDEFRTPRPTASIRTTSTPGDLDHRLSWPRLQATSPSRKRADTSPRREQNDGENNELRSQTPMPKQRGKAASNPEPPSPLPTQIPLPPMAIPTYLQLELSTTKPSPLFIYRTPADDFPYESARLKFERLQNFLLLPPQLEQVLFFGTIACLDAWIHTFTILPLRFIQAVSVLVQWWAHVLARETRFVLEFIYHGVARVYERRQKERERGRRSSIDSTATSRSTSIASRSGMPNATSFQPRKASESSFANGGTSEAVQAAIERKIHASGFRKHRRTRSQPSALSSSHKSDLLQGLVVICTCVILMRLDASRMYHSIRGQTDIKLYVIYNVLEVGDKLLSALGQDIFECLNSNETLDRRPDGRSKILRPFGMFILALIYNVIHSSALFYQVVTLNVAVNAYSNALLTLLLSNQFVEIKSAVFKKFEKENLFQLTCADVVERLQLWIMLIIIALRNVVEVGGFSMLSGSSVVAGGAAEIVKNSTSQRSFSFLPHAFTILPHWTGEILSPFLVVLGSEMMVDWLKHAYIIKFNNMKPAVYQKFLDVLAKDYYTNAFVNQNLTKRVGLPVLPLSCLFIRASVQTYHMFIATHLPPPIPSTATALSVESAATTSPATTAALERFDEIIRRALGRSAFGIGRENAPPGIWRFIPDADDVIAVLTMLVFFLGAFMVLLAFKLILGMCLLKFARNRYSSIKEREKLSLDTQGKRVGGWGMVELDDEKKKIIYDDDPDGARNSREREKKAKDKADKAGADFGKVSRYEMSAKRIW